MQGGAVLGQAYEEARKVLFRTCVGAIVHLSVDDPEAGLGHIGGRLLLPRYCTTLLLLWVCRGQGGAGWRCICSELL